MTASGTLKGLAWLVGVALALPVVACLALLLINWRDQPPSESALQLTAVYRDRPPVTEADGSRLQSHDDPAPDDESYKSSRAPAAQKIANAFRFTMQECADALEGKDELLRGWIRSEQLAARSIPEPAPS